MLGCSKLSKLPESLGVMDCLKELDLSQTALKELPSSLVHLKNLKKLSVSGSPASWYTFGIFKRRIPHSLGCSVFTSSKGLCSLKVLDLRDLNLCEGAVPEDIGYLSSLEELYLSGNNFVTLPESIRRLSKLSVLYLENCKSLRQLSVLPINGTLYVFTDDSTSLSMLSVPPPKLGLYANLAKEIASGTLSLSLSLSFDIIVSMVQGISRSVKQFHTVIPGSYIPEWFSNQSVGNSLTVETPPHSCSRVMGIALCAIFLEQTNPLPECIYAYCDHFGIQCSSQHFSCRQWDSHPKICHLVSDHLWVLYVSLERIIKPGQIRISFDTFYYSKDLDRRLIADLKPKKCGACLVYKQDVEELNRTANVADNIISHCKAMGIQL
ncbi:TMV resistance protein N-like [Pyrus ussuriensis x Pyrus communis]|uniref:TMV resistance protein N-like n=1 Tax=Pyrus ussuriensis x Pyrus communis TaxID=2448454 RepID=A0A5N5FQR2_9ROSA|nr:TMV resistance protein N-like [Pyrus ussuriensis x Pyrus communis]